MRPYGNRWLHLSSYGFDPCLLRGFSEALAAWYAAPADFPVFQPIKFIFHPARKPHAVLEPPCTTKRRVRLTSCLNPLEQSLLLLPYRNPLLLGRAVIVVGRGKNLAVAAISCAISFCEGLSGGHPVMFAWFRGVVVGLTCRPCDTTVLA